MDLLKVKLGDELNIADAKFKVTAKIEQDSNQELGFSGFSPTVIIAQSEVARTNAIQVGSRIDYRLLMAGNPADTRQYETWFKQKIKSENGTSDEADAEVEGQELEQQGSLRLRNASEGNTRLMKPIANLDTFCNWPIFSPFCYAGLPLL